MAMITNSQEETIKAGEKLGHLLKKGMTVLLEGELAAGKTTFTKGIGKALHIHSVINSPTFTILKIYEGDLTLYHIDAYRLENNDYDLGFEEYADEGITVIEWPQYYAHLPEEYLSIHFRYIDENQREITFSGKGEQYEKIVKEMLC